MTNKRRISEAVLRQLNGGNPKGSSKFKEPEVKITICQVIAELLKLETVNLNLPFGSAPPHAMVATYDDVAVTAIDDKYCKITLPAQPISLPMQMGVWLVYRDMDCPFIPVQPGQMHLAVGSKHTNVSAMIGDKLIPYEPQGKILKVRRSKDDIGDTVTVQLLVIDPDTITDSDMLPLPQDLENQVIIKTLERYGVTLPKDNTPDNLDN